MQSFVWWILLALVIGMAFPIFVFCVEIIAAVILPQPPISYQVAGEKWPRIGVLIPAHNESAGLKPTIENVKSQLRQGDRLLVVADNCTDDTAAVAASLSAEVIDRHDPLHIGKGYALDFGIKYLDCDPPEVLIIVDADCEFSEGSLDNLAAVCRAEGRPVQALNLMKAPDGFLQTFELAEFAWRVKNWARPLGLKALQLPCQLSGTGMAFPWEIISSVRLASGEIVEDLKLGLDLAKAGTPAVFCSSASVVSYFPTSQAGIDSQRRRWQQGHLDMIVRLAPRMLLDGIIKRNIGLIMLTIDLIVPPLFLLALIEIGLLSASLIALWFGDAALIFLIALTTNGLFALAIVFCWINFGRDVMTGKSLLRAPFLLGKKFLFYQRILFGRSVVHHWIRTDRGKSKPP